MRLLAFTALLAIAAPLAPAHAASCEKQIKRLYDGGALDPFKRGPREEVTVETAPDGSEVSRRIVRWETPVRVATKMNGMVILQYGAEVYMGQDWDGPWARQQDLTYDPEEQARGVSKTYTENMSGAECPGKTDLEGQKVEVYRFSYEAGSEQGGSWWSGDLTLFVGKDGLVRQEERNIAASWAPEPKDSVTVTTITPLPDDFSLTPVAE